MCNCLTLYDSCYNRFMRTVVILHPICIIMSEYGKEKPRRVVTGTKASAKMI